MSEQSTTVRITFNVNDPKSYRQFLRVKSLPRFRIRGRVAEIPEEYAGLIGLGSHQTEMAYKAPA